MIHRPEFSLDFGREAVHLFCGAFGGWSQALRWMPKSAIGITVGRIFIDHDVDVMSCWPRKFDEPYYQHLPISKVKIWDAADIVGSWVIGPVADRTWLHQMFAQVNLLITASPPCVSWSKGGRRKGVQCQEG